MFWLLSRRFCKVPHRVPRALRDPPGQLLSQLFSSHVRSGFWESPDQLGLLRWGVRSRARQCHGVRGEPRPKLSAWLPCSNPTLPLPRLRQRLHQPRCAGTVQHHIHPECHTQSPQHVWARRPLQVHTDPYFGPLESEPVPVLSRGNIIYRWVNQHLAWVNINLTVILFRCFCFFLLCACLSTRTVMSIQTL